MGEQQQQLQQPVTGAELPKCDFAEVEGLHWVNQQPHPFCIGGEHVTYAHDHGGALDEEVFEKIPCKMELQRGYCNRPYREHTKGDHVAFVKLLRDCSAAEMREWLKSILPWAEGEKVDGFAFVDGEERFRILQEEKSDDN